MLLITGAGQQLTDWPQAFLDALIAKGYRITVFDSRDMGCTTRMDTAGRPNFVAINAALTARRAPPVPYTLETMAHDTIGLMDALKLSGAHLIGVAEGAVIAEMIAAEQPQRPMSLTLMMASSGNPNIPTPADPVRLAGLPDAPKADAPRESVIAYKTALARALESPTFHRTDEAMLEAAGRSADRNYDPDALARHSAAALAIPDLRQRLRLITAPTLVIQGEQDPIIPTILAREVARLIPDAKFSLIADMAHDIPDLRVEEIVAGIAAIAQPKPPA